MSEGLYIKKTDQKIKIMEEKMKIIRESENSFYDGTQTVIGIAKVYCESVCHDDCGLLPPPPKENL